MFVVGTSPAQSIHLMLDVTDCGCHVPFRRLSHVSHLVVHSLGLSEACSLRQLASKQLHSCLVAAFRIGSHTRYDM